MTPAILLLIFILIIGIIGITYTTRKVIITAKAKKEFYKYLKYQQPKLREQLAQQFRASMSRNFQNILNYKKYGDVLDSLIEIINFQTSIDRNALFELYINNTQEGRINCLIDLLLA